MKQSLQLRLGQHLTMTPQLQQAIRLLQLSTLELQVEVQQALESNLMLEEAEDDADVVDYDDNGEPIGGVSETPAEIEAETVEPADIPDELAVDSGWEDIYDGVNVAGSGAPVDGRGDLEGQRGGSDSLHDHLRWQLGLTNLNEHDRALAEALIDSIDDNGYLRTPLEEFQLGLSTPALEVELDEIEAVLRYVQSFDPAGVGARDLAECLAIQLRQLPQQARWREEALELVNRHLDLLGAHDYPQLMRRLGINEESLREVIGLIQSMHPRPGSQIHSAPLQYVVPDVYVFKRSGAWQVELNGDALPRLRINPQYAAFIRDSLNSADSSRMRAHMQEARWFLKSLRSRSETLLRVARCIVDRQQSFLEHGAEAMRPMVLYDVARVVDMHESTISRATTQKYMHTPRGIYELKYFFSSHVSTQSGGEASSTAIRALLKRLIAAENPKKPLSDSKLAKILSDQGINVARRTVAKYREALIIPASSERRRLL